MSHPTLNPVTADGSSIRSERPSRRAVDHVLSEALFRGAVVRERHRADRSDQALAIVVLSLRDVDDGATARVWRSVTNAVKATRRDADVIGWLRHRSALAMLVTDIPQPCDEVVGDITYRIQGELACRLEPEDLDRLDVRVHVHPEVQSTAAGFRPIDTLIPMRREIPAPHHAIKRGLDIVGSAILLALLSPVFLVLAALVKATSRGPVFFRQTRIGERATPFTMLKFRSMKTDAGDSLHQSYVSWFIQSSGTAKGSGETFKITNDPRVTPVGRFIRRTSLDELPQLWNVLRGDMSLVGPRPPLPYEVEKYKAWHCRRVHDAKPGITGLWQVTGRSRTTFDEMVRLDLRYAKARSLWLDLKILLATPRAVIGGKGAC
jgi:exopolysaccharide biosynthesis polyprenyl glycosylphosphotransferase